MPDSFLPIDTHYASNILSELCNEGKLVRVATGIYVKPKESRFGPVIPTIGEIAQTIAKRDDAQLLQPERLLRIISVFQHKFQ